MAKACDKTVFKKFRSGNFDVKVTPKSIKTDEDKVKALTDARHQITTRDVVERLNLLNSTFHDHVKCFYFISKLNIGEPHDLTERNLLHRNGVYRLLLKRQENYLVLK